MLLSLPWTISACFTFNPAGQRERERERYYTYPALRLIQVLPGHPLADPKDETVSPIQRRTSLGVNRDVNKV